MPQRMPAARLGSGSIKRRRQGHQLAKPSADRHSSQDRTFARGAGAVIRLAEGASLRLIEFDYPCDDDGRQREPGHGSPLRVGVCPSRVRGS